jgi:hypothetical protein
LSSRGWFAVQPVPLAGPEHAVVAYRLPWGDKQILFTGRIPIPLSEAAGIALQRALAGQREKIAAYVATLKQLGDLSPDFWLPAVTADRQNAHLYDRDWEDILEHNRKLLVEITR